MLPVTDFSLQNAACCRLRTARMLYGDSNRKHKALGKEENFQEVAVMPRDAAAAAAAADINATDEDSDAAGRGM